MAAIGSKIRREPNQIRKMQKLGSLKAFLGGRRSRLSEATATFNFHTSSTCKGSEQPGGPFCGAFDDVNVVWGHPPRQGHHECRSPIPLSSPFLSSIEQCQEPNDLLSFAQFGEGMPRHACAREYKLIAYRVISCVAHRARVHKIEPEVDLRVCGCFSRRG